MTKIKLTIEFLKEEAKRFSKIESQHDEPSIFGVTDGKAVGTSSGTPMILCVSHLEVDQKTIHNHLGEMPGLAKSPKADLSKGFTITQVAEKLYSSV